MALFNEQGLRNEARLARQTTTVAIARSNLGIDDATHYLDSWALELIDYAGKLGYNVVDISGPDLTYERMTEILTATKPAILFNFSHGCRNYLMGNDMRCTLTRGWEDMINCGVCGRPSNLKAVQGTAIVAYSCHSSYQLAKCAVAYGAPVYVGWTDNLIVVTDAFGTQDIFKQALMPMAQRILQGWSVGDSVSKARDDLLNVVRTYKSVELISVGLWYNRKYLTLHGNPNWSLI